MANVAVDIKTHEVYFVYLSIVDTSYGEKRRETVALYLGFGQESSNVQSSDRVAPATYARLPPNDLHDSPPTSKLSPPLNTSALIPRPRLTERLNDALRHKLTLISAPAGFGKTTLIGQWVEQIGCPVAWLCLDSADNDPMRFWRYVVHAIGKVRGYLLDSSSIRLPVHSIEAILSVANNDGGGKSGLVLVLDDYHLIKHQAIHDGLTYMIDHLPGQMHVVIASRADPPIPLARLRAYGLMVELRASDLSFTPSETGAFLNDTMHLELSSKEVAALEERTEGWVAGLQIAALMMRDLSDRSTFVKTFAGDYRYVADYLTQEVLDRQPEAVQSFLLRTSILDRLNGALCEAVAELEPGEGAATLSNLEFLNLFTTPLDNQRQWYRYHYLLADCLRAHLRARRPALVAELHTRAAKWYVQYGMREEAIGHALAAGDFDLAADLLQEVTEGLFARGEVATLLAWLRAIPDEIVARRPYLCVRYATALLTTSELADAEKRLRDAARALGLDDDVFTTGMDGDDKRNAELQRIAGEMESVLVFLATGRHDFPLAISLSNRTHASRPERDDLHECRVLNHLGQICLLNGDVAKAAEALEGASARFRTAGHVWGAVRTASQLASAQAKQAKLRQAVQTYRQALRYASDQGVPQLPALAWATVGLGFVEYEWNDLPSAAAHAAEGIHLADFGGLLHARLFSMALVARLQQARGETDAAIETMRDAEYRAERANLTQELARAREYQARLALKLRDPTAAIEWARTSSLTLRDEPSYVNEGAYLTLARLGIASNEPRDALGLLGRMLDAAEGLGRTGSVIKVLVLLASGLFAVQETYKALAALERALLLGEREDYLRTFADAGDPIPQLLPKLIEVRRPRSTRAHLSQDYLRRVVMVTQMRSTGRTGGIEVNSDNHLLSAREMDVLRLIADGRSREEISRQLIVSFNTVKTHIGNIYTKLDVHSNIEAVAKARQSGIL